MFDYLVLGGGISGIACVRYLKKLNPQVKILVADTRASFPLLAEKSLLKGSTLQIKASAQFTLELLKSAKQVVVSPGINTKVEPFVSLKEQGLVYGELELFKRSVKKPVVGITGSNGKSTVTTLMGEVIRDVGYKVAVGGNLGIPALDLLLDSPEYYVLELSSFQLETVENLPLAVAIFLNFSPDHEDRYDRLADYLLAKQRIFQQAAHAVVCIDEPDTYRGLSIPLSSFGLAKQADYRVLDGMILRHGKPILSAKQLKVQGQHNLLNVAAVLAASEILNLSVETILPTICHFTGLPHRCQWVTERKGVTWYNDSKGTNVGATLTALRSLGEEKRNIILILGGIGKKADFAYLNTALNQYVKVLILFGRDKQLIKQQINYSGTIFIADTLSEVVKLAADNSNYGDKVVFSPACASMDMFQNFEDRGEQFMQLVLSL